MRALTVRQPWAWAIVHGGKSVENRSRNVAGSYRGPLASHAALQASEQEMRDQRVRSAWQTHGAGDPLEALKIGAVVGVVDLVDVHSSVGCECSEWADDTGFHLVLAAPRPVSPVPAKGRLGLWQPDAALLAQISS